MRPVLSIYKVTFPFGVLYPPEYQHLTADHLHHGIDMGTPKGTMVYAAVDGVISALDYWRGFGNVVVIKFTSGWLLNKKQYRLILAHLDLILTKKKIGDKVAKSEQVALSGDSGMATGHPHLHSEVQLLTKDGWRYCDPSFAIGNA